LGWLDTSVDYTHQFQRRRSGDYFLAQGRKEPEKMAGSQVRINTSNMHDMLDWLIHLTAVP
jgi:hypothetical protein